MNVPAVWTVAGVLTRIVAAWRANALPIPAWLRKVLHMPPQGEPWPAARGRWLDWLVSLFRGGKQPTPPVAIPVEAGGVNCNRGAAITTLTAVDPRSNDGWDGDCPGADVDATMHRRLGVAAGIARVVMRLNGEATKLGVRGGINEAARGFTRGDLLVLTYSGHGGQWPDRDGDEADGKDETICLWDGQMIDDEFLQILWGLPNGLRVLLISDCCHSEGNFRSAVRRYSRGYLAARKGIPIVNPKLHRGFWDIRWDGQLIQFAGCREQSVSMGASNGGTWTVALDATWYRGIPLRKWFDDAAARMPGDQTPVWVEYGQVTDAFRHGRALE